jgi:Coenzyme PQQ synthesis protein D (PqqD)
MPRLVSFPGEDKGKGRANFAARAHARALRAHPSAIRRSSAPSACRSGMTLAPSAAMVDRVRVSPLVRGSISSDGLVLLDVRDGAVLASNVVGARIWRLIEEHGDTRAIARSIAAEFEIDLDRASRDVDAFVAALCARGIISTEQPC